MSDGEGSDDDRGQCQRCGGRITATHMLTKSYEIDEDGRWHRRIDEFAEDLVLVCASCGEEPEGRFEADDDTFAFKPDRRRDDREGSTHSKRNGGQGEPGEGTSFHK